MKVKKWYVVEFLVAPKAKGPGEMTAGTIEGEAQGKATTARRRCSSRRRCA